MEDGAGSGVAGAAISRDGGQTWQALPLTPTATGGGPTAWLWQVQPDLRGWADGTYEVQVKLWDQAGLQATYRKAFTVAQPKPHIVVRPLGTGARWTFWDLLTFEVQTACLPIHRMRIVVEGPERNRTVTWDTSTWEAPLADGRRPVVYSVTWRWDTAWDSGRFAPPGEYPVRFEAWDAWGRKYMEFGTLVVPVMSGPTPTPAPLPSPTATPTARPTPTVAGSGLPTTDRRRPTIVPPTPLATPSPAAFGGRPTAPIATATPLPMATPVPRHTGLVGQAPTWAKTVAVGTLFTGVFLAWLALAREMAKRRWTTARRVGPGELKRLVPPWLRRPRRKPKPSHDHVSDVTERAAKKQEEMALLFAETGERVVDVEEWARKEQEEMALHFAEQEESEIGASPARIEARGGYTLDDPIRKRLAARYEAGPLVVLPGEKALLWKARYRASLQTVAELRAQAQEVCAKEGPASPGCAYTSALVHDAEGRVYQQAWMNPRPVPVVVRRLRPPRTEVQTPTPEIEARGGYTLDDPFRKRLAARYEAGPSVVLPGEKVLLWKARYRASLQTVAELRAQAQEVCAKEGPASPGCAYTSALVHDAEGRVYQQAWMNPRPVPVVVRRLRPPQTEVQTPTPEIDPVALCRAYEATRRAALEAYRRKDVRTWLEQMTALEDIALTLSVGRDSLEQARAAGYPVAEEDLQAWRCETEPPLRYWGVSGQITIPFTKGIGSASVTEIFVPSCNVEIRCISRNIGYGLAKKESSFLNMIQESGKISKVVQQLQPSGQVFVGSFPLGHPPCKNLASFFANAVSVDIGHFLGSGFLFGQEYIARQISLSPSNFYINRSVQTYCWEVRH